MNQKITIKTPSLREAEILFQSWRDHKKFKCEPIPGNLWDIAYTLSERHGVAKVSTVLNLSATKLRDRTGKIVTEPKIKMGTVEAWQFTCSMSNGTTLNLSGNGAIPDINQSLKILTR